MKITKSGVYADIAQITDGLDIAGGVIAELPNLTSIGGSVYVRENAKLTVPNLTSIGGGVYVRENAKLTVPNLTSIGGDVDVYENAKLTVPNLTSIGGSVYVYKNAKLTVPNLTSIGGSVYVYKNAKLTVPNLTSIGGYVDVYENAKLTVPNLTSIGGGVYVRENAKLTRSKTDVPYEAAMLERSFNSSGHTFADRIVAKIIHTRGSVRKILIAGKTKASYLVTSGDYHAHGETLKQAQTDLQFKMVAEKLKNDPILPDTVITIPYYRAVTGACEFGVKSWMESTFTKAQNADILANGITAKELLPILRAKTAYGFEKFQSLVTF